MRSGAGAAYATLRRRGYRTCEQQPEMVGETDLTDQFLGKVAAANQDRGFVRRRYRRAVMGLGADFH